jgi:N4-gp56 family major capsid protein
MAATQYTTMLANLFDPEVVADAIDRKLIDAIRFSPLARIDRTLVGRAGDELTMPFYRYIGAATAVNEGADIPISLLTQGTTKVKVSKIGKAVQFTDEAMLSGWGNISSEAARQVVLAINDKVESLLLENMGATASQTKTIAAASGGTDKVADDIADALTLFGEDIDGEKVLIIPPALYARLRKTAAWVPNTELGANAIVRGTVGAVHGCQIVVSNRLISTTHGTYAKTTDTSISSSKTYYILNELGAYEAVENPVVADIGDYYEQTSATGSVAYIVKPGALSIVMKRDTLVEMDRDILDETNVIKASKLFAPYVYDANKVIKLPIA